MTAPTRTGSATWPWYLLTAIVVVALAVGVTRSRPPATDSERVAAIAATIKCPVCAGESVEQSAVEISRQIRVDIARRITAGQTDDQIQDYYRSVYGDQILLTPSGTGLSGVVWALPVILLVCAVAGLASVFRRWRAADDVVASDSDRSLVAEAMALVDRRGGRAAGGDGGEGDEGDEGDEDNR